MLTISRPEELECRARTRPLRALVSLDQASLVPSVPGLRIADPSVLDSLSVSMVRFILNHNQVVFHHTVPISLHIPHRSKNRIIKTPSTYWTKQPTENRWL